MVTFVSYNPTGLDIAKINWVKDIVTEFGVDFFSIQEHFKNTQNTQKYFNQHFSDKRCYVTPAFRAPGQLSGRCAGGLAQLSDKVIKTKMDKILVKTWRIQAQIIHLMTYKILWINSYLPTDPGPGAAAWDETELVTTLAQVEALLSSNTFDECVWAGDLNWSMERNTRFATIMSSFMTRLGLVPVWSHHPVDYTHIHTDYKSTSTLDHFIVTPRLLPLIEESGVIHRGDNRSRHSPILLRLRLGGLKVKEGKEGKGAAPRRPAWSRAKEAELHLYTRTLEQRLVALQVPPCLSSDPHLRCTNPHCDDSQHSKAGDSFLLDIVTTMVETSHQTIPMSGGVAGGPGRASRGGIPGWAEEVEPYRQESVRCHKLWLELRRPNTGPTHDAMVRSRTRYHHAVRRIKRMEQELRSRKLLEAAMAGDMDLLKEMKKVRGKGEDDLPETVDGAESEDTIAETFREVYEALYNSHETPTDTLKQTIKELITNDSINEVNKITGDSVKAATAKMKSRKSDVSGGFASDCLLFGPDILFFHLAAAFRGWMVHSTVTSSVLA